MKVEGGYICTSIFVSVCLSLNRITPCCGWIFVIQMYSGITRGRVFNEEHYAHRFQKLIYLHLFTECFMKISPQSVERIQLDGFLLHLE